MYSSISTEPERPLSFESLGQVNKLCMWFARVKWQKKPMASGLDKEKLVAGNAPYPNPIQEEE